MTRAITIALIAMALSGQVRDNRTITGVGTATIIGTVLADDRDRHPLRRARVSLSGSELDIARVTVTDDGGRFAFEGLPAGRYNISAAKDGFVTMSAGADRPGRPGLGIEVKAGQSQVTSVRLPRGAVITGMVRLPTGEPAPGVSVTPLAQRYVANAGERRLMPLTINTVTTDDRGIYRIFGLAAGSYVVGAAPRISGGAPFGVEIVTQSDAEIRRALSEVKEQITSSRPGMLTPPPSAPRAVEAPRRTVTYTSIYYPGTPSERQAAHITVAPGEVRSGIDIDLEYVPTAMIEGYVTAPPEMRVRVGLVDTVPSMGTSATRGATTPGPDGRFTFRSVPPGQYSIVATAYTASARPGTGPESNDTLAWGRTDVILAGEDLTGVTVALRPPVTISGRIVFKGTTPAPPLPTLRVPVPASTFGAGMAFALPNVVLDGHRFTIPGAIPGVYRFPNLPQGVRSPIGPWWLESIVVKDRDILDADLDLQESITDAVVTFSDRASELSGLARYVSGEPFREGLVIVFSADRRKWFANSRRIAAVTTARDGRYVVRNLPAGEYFVTVAVGLDRNEWFDPEVLTSLAESAQRVTISGTEVKIHDLTLR